MMGAVASTDTARMRASVLTEIGTLTVEDRPIPVPAPGEVRVAVAAVGVCGSDVHYYRRGRIGDHVVRAPLVLGHEPAGRITAVGDAVDPTRWGSALPSNPSARAGAAATVRPVATTCARTSSSNATPPVDGALCGYVVIDAEMAHPIPDSLSDEAAALLVGMGADDYRAVEERGVQP